MLQSYFTGEETEVLGSKWEGWDPELGRLVLGSTLVTMLALLEDLTWEAADSGCQPDHPATHSGVLRTPQAPDGAGVPGSVRAGEGLSRRTFSLFPALSETVFGWFISSGCHNTGYIHP